MAKKLKMKTITIQVRTSATNKQLKQINSIYFGEGQAIDAICSEAKKDESVSGIVQVTVQDSTQ